MRISGESNVSLDTLGLPNSAQVIQDREFQLERKKQKGLVAGAFFAERRRTGYSSGLRLCGHVKPLSCENLESLPESKETKRNL